MRFVIALVLARQPSGVAGVEDDLDDLLPRDVVVHELIVDLVELRLEVDGVLHDVRQVGGGDEGHHGRPAAAVAHPKRGGSTRAGIRPGLEDSGVDEQTEVRRPGALLELQVLLDHRRFDHRRPMDLGTDDDIEVGRELEVAFDSLLPDRIDTQILGDDPDLGSHEGETRLRGQAQIEFELLRAFGDGHPPPGDRRVSSHEPYRVGVRPSRSLRANQA